MADVREVVHLVSNDVLNVIQTLSEGRAVEILPSRMQNISKFPRPVGLLTDRRQVRIDWTPYCKAYTKGN